ncbi:MAG: hypothetical protein M5U22_15120 [Thermoleophilia bacterium]|nr:hypothetical protein [Thermoleophilia bacterium]
MKRIWVIGSILAVALAGVGAALLLEGGGHSTAVSTTTTASPPVTSPYDFKEAPFDVDLATLPDAKFASLTIRTEAGLTSYLVTPDNPAFLPLARAVAGSREVPVAEAPAGDDSTLTFVMRDRSTVTFVLDLDRGLLERAGSALEVVGDLEALVKAAAR